MFVFNISTFVLTHHLLDLQGPQGQQGVQGEKGPQGEGFPGPKVISSIFVISYCGDLFDNTERLLTLGLIHKHYSNIIYLDFVT